MLVAASLFCRAQGAAELAPCGYVRKYIPALRSDSLAQWPAHGRALRCFTYGAGFVFGITYACENCVNRAHRVPACCRGIKLLLIRRSRLALFARLRRFCVCLGYIGAMLYG